MSLNVALTLGMRNALFSIGDITNQQSLANKRLATARRSTTRSTAR